MTDPRLSRRAFLRAGAALAPLGLAACGWDGGRTIRPTLAGISRLNDWVGERLVSHSRLAREYPISERNPHFPSYFISDRTPILADPSGWALTVAGTVRKPMRLTLDQLMALPRRTYTVKHHCVEGWTAIATWTGVPLTAIAALVEPTADAHYLRFDSFDEDYFNGWDLTSAMHPQTILAYGCNDRPLMPDHGAPLRLYSPIKLGYKLTKYLTAVTFTRSRPGGYWEDQGYPWLGGV